MSEIAVICTVCLELFFTKFYTIFWLNVFSDLKTLLQYVFLHLSLNLIVIYRGCHIIMLLKTHQDNHRKNVTILHTKKRCMKRKPFVLVKFINR